MSISAAEALRRQQAPQRRAERRPAGDVSLGPLTLDRQRLSARIEQAITGASLERTIEGASTLSLSLLDVEGAMLAEGFFNRASDLELDGLGYTLVRVASPTLDVLELTFEDREVHLLRRYTAPRKAVRGKVTRAEFALSLVREVKERRIGFYSPELRVTQPVARDSGESVTALAPDPETADAERRPGFGPGASITVKGAPADAEQREIMGTALGVAVSLGAPRLAQLALIVALSQESTVRNLTGGHSSSVGVLQLLDIHLGGSTSTSGGRRDVALVVRLFLERGFTGAGGAVANARSRPSSAPSDIAAIVQGNAAGASDYAPWNVEAVRTLAAFSGDAVDPGATAAPGGSVTRTGPYEFTRGEPGGGRESSWIALRRLAEEVGWRRFMVASLLYFIADETLIASRPRMRLGRRSEGVDDIAFDFHAGQSAATATITARAERWAAPPGSVVVLERMGPANGRYIVQVIRRADMFDQATEIELIKPRPSLPEPAAETVTVDLGAGAGAANAGPLGQAPAGAPGPTGGVGSLIGRPYQGTHNGAPPFDNWQSANAVDISLPIGSPIYAVEAGTIAKTGGSPGTAGRTAGLNLTLDGASGNSYFYTHNSTQSVSTGDRVTAGQEIARSGAANGVPHLHFSQRSGSPITTSGIS